MQSILSSVWLASPLITHYLEDSCVVKNRDCEAKWHKHPEKLQCAPKASSKTRYPMTAVGFANKIHNHHFPDSEKLFMAASIRHWALPPETVHRVRQTSDLLKSKPLIFFIEILLPKNIPCLFYYFAWCIPFLFKESTVVIIWVFFEVSDRKKISHGWRARAVIAAVCVLSGGCELAEGTSIHQVCAAPRGCGPVHDTPTAQPVT